MTDLPEKFLERMKNMLGEEYEQFLRSYEEPPCRGLRWNLLKCREDTPEKLGFSLLPTPFSPVSFYLPEEAQKLGLLPLHHAGAFYLQEPSAASAAAVLAPEKGEKILDLCAAPGGKSTQIAALLNGKGLLWSNEIVRNRAEVLLSNLERMGVRNSVVSSCHPDVLCSRLAGFFDRVLVDAPCSGEGMFRKDPQAAAEWSPEHVASCAVRQRAVLDSGAQAVKGGGVLVYSTCTFSEEENEGVIREFLTSHRDFQLEKISVPFGRPGFGLTETRRIFPMDGGEGHFVAKMRRISGEISAAAPYNYSEPPAAEQGRNLCRTILTRDPSEKIEQIGEMLLLLPEGLPNLRGLGVLRAGVPLGEIKKNRIEPSHALFMASRPSELRSVLDLPGNSPEIAAFLRGEEIDAQGWGGYTAVAVDGVVTGFGKCSEGRLKNRYPKGLRNNK